MPRILTPDSAPEARVEVWRDNGWTLLVGVTEISIHGGDRTGTHIRMRGVGRAHVHRGETIQVTFNGVGYRFLVNEVSEDPGGLDDDFPRFQVEGTELEILGDPLTEEARPMPGSRCCGNRIAGGIYWETHTLASDQARDRHWSAEAPLRAVAGRENVNLAVESFIVDPPVPIDVAAIRLPNVGVKVFERQGVTHVLDWIGVEYYRNVADFIEEGRAIGFSRRVSRSFPFERLTPESRLLCVHARATVANPSSYGLTGPCPTGVHHPVASDAMCARLWWYDLDPTTVAVQDNVTATVRQLPNAWYTGWRRPLNVVPDYRPGIFLSLPLTRLAVVRGRDAAETMALRARVDRAQSVVRDTVNA